MAIPVSELQKIAPSSIIELFTLELNTLQHGETSTYRFHAGANLNANGEVVWAGNTYQRFPVEAEGFEYNGQGSLPRPQLRVSNLLGTITTILLGLPSGLEGAKVTRIRTLARYLDAANFPVRRNLFSNTNAFAWSESGTAAGAQVRWRQPNVALAPDGTLTATKLSVSTDNDLQRIFVNAPGVVANQPVTYSIYAKAGEYSRVALSASSVATAQAIFDLNAGTWLVNGNATSRFAVDSGNGWWRIGITYTPTATNTVPWVLIANNSSQTVFIGDGSSGLFLWGAQIEVGDTASEYQPVEATWSQNPYGTPDPTAEFPREIYFVDRKAIENRDVVEFELAAAFDLQGVRAPKRQCIANICQWTYRSAECGYIGTAYFDEFDVSVATAAQDVCGKRLTSCEARFGIYVRTGSVTVGSNVVTLSSTQGLLVGDPIRGFGLPVGSSISAILTGTTARATNNATATTTVNVTGTPSPTAASMTVTSATGLAPGHVVSGPFMNGQTITSISGTTLTLSERLYSFSRDGTYDRVDGDDFVKFTNTSGIVVGMRVFGSFGIDTTVTEVNTNVSIRIDTPPSPAPLDTAFVRLYFMAASPAAATYTFSGNTSYALRDPDAALPFGSFPGVGTFFS